MIDKAHALLRQAKAVIFDMDGVLVDTMPLWEESKELFLEKHGILKEQLLTKTFGMGLKDIVEVYQRERGLQGDRDVLSLEWRDLFYSMLSEKGLLPLPGIIAFVSNLSKQKKLAVATGGHTKIIAKELLEDVKLAQYFVEIISSDDVQKGKPDPDVFLFAAKKLGEIPQECVVIEDAVNGVIAAHRAGIPVIGVNSDERQREKLLNAGATAVVASFEELV